MSEHCVKVCLKLSEEFGTSAEVAAIHELSDTLADAIEKSEVGEFDGDEFGCGECTLYMYGPNADRLFEAVKDHLTSSAAAEGGYAIKRYGPAEDGVKEVTLIL